MVTKMARTVTKKPRLKLGVTNCKLFAVTIEIPEKDFHRDAFLNALPIEGAIDRKILGGAPCIAGTRIPVYAILQLVEAGYTRKRILKSFPSLSQEDLEAALRFSVIIMER